MGFLNNKENKFLSTKLTDLGRKKLALGQLTFSKWAIGDSEINYQYEKRKGDNETLKTKIFAPKAKQPNLRSFLGSSLDLSQTKFDILNDDIVLTKLDAVDYNESRGILTKNTSGATVLNTSMRLSTGTIAVSSIDSYNLTIKSGLADDILTNSIIVIDIPAPNKTAADSTVNTIKNGAYCVARVISSKSGVVTTNIRVPKHDKVKTYNVTIYPGSEVKEVSIWNTYPELEFYSNSLLNYDVETAKEVGETLAWDFNVVALESLINADTANTINLGDEVYGVINAYLNYNKTQNATAVDTAINCGGEDLYGVQDEIIKNIGVGHFSNNDYANVYGDYIYINHDENKNFRLTNSFISFYNSSKLTNVTGAEVISVGEVKVIEDTDIKYYDLAVEGDLGLIVGKVFPDLKIFTIDNEEFLMTMTASSNRNYMLSGLEGRLDYSLDGLLPSGYDMYVTYGINSPDSIHSLDYLLIQNTTQTSKDIELSFNEKATNNMFNPSKPADGGYSAKNLTIYYQIVSNGNRPIFGEWMEYTLPVDVSTIYDSVQYVDPNKLAAYKVKLNKDVAVNKVSSELYSDTFYGLGSETVLLGNVTAYIGLSIFKSIIKVDINGNKFDVTTNPTHDNETIIVSEVGVYDSDEDLVMVAKLSNPITLDKRIIVTLELSIDF